MRSYIAELFGTFLLTLTISITLVGAHPLATPIAAALTVMLLVYTVGAISGAHLNPGVTIGLLSISKISKRDAMWYIGAQLLGAIFALFTTLMLTGRTPKPIGMVTPQMGLAEVLGACILVFGICSVVYGKVSDAMSGVVIGASLLLGIAVALSASNGVLNPAVAIGISSISLYHIVSPIIGGILGAQFYRWIAK